MSDLGRMMVVGIAIEMVVIVTVVALVVGGIGFVLGHWVF